MPIALFAREVPLELSGSAERVPPANAERHAPSAERDAASDARLRGLRAELIRELRAEPQIYYRDLTLSAGLAWTLAVLATVAPWPIAGVLVFIGSLAMYRAVYFIHEISHQRKTLPGFELFWNAVCGAWVMMPSFMADSHVDHHRLTTYGTDLDPEYERVATFGPVRIVLSIAIMPLVPVLLLLRFALLAPLSWLIPPLRTIVLERASALVTNSAYVRDAASSRTWRVLFGELAACVVALSSSAAIVTGHLPVRVAVVWFAFTSIAMTINQARTMMQHAYENDGSVMTLTGQVADSTNVRAPSWLTIAFFPLGNEYHALHHLAPSLPYHALAEAHARLIAANVPAAYGATEHDGIVRGLAQVLWRSGRRAARVALPDEPSSLEPPSLQQS